MTQEEKNLLLKDLCGRLPYGVKIKVNNSVIVLDSPNLFTFQTHPEITFKPYLRKLSFSNMSSDEKFEYDELRHFYTSGFDFNVNEVDWLLAHHFDFRSLIEKGLALEAPADMYKIE